MSQLQRRWELIKSYIGWEDYLGFGIFFLGVLGFIIGPIPVLHELRAELIGIGITVLIIDNANEAIKRREQIREEKNQLIVQMGSPNREFAIEAVRQLEARGWLNDGSLRGATLVNANLQEATLKHANLQQANLSNANLMKANLYGADLQEATLKHTNLQRANLSHANLQDADLTFANLLRANLLNADLKGAEVSSANLLEADLIGAEVTQEQLNEAKSLRRAILPDGSKHK